MASRVTVAELARVVRSVDPGGFVVPGRIVRRAIKHDRELPTMAVRVPHRWSFTVGDARALEVIDRAELGLVADEPIPRDDHPPGRARGRGSGRPDAGRGAPRRLAGPVPRAGSPALDARIAAGTLAITDLRERIIALGPAVFEEARTVLRQEDYLLPPRDDLAIYVEFAAVYLELREFDASLLAAYFPAIDDRGRSTPCWPGTSTPTP